jgi:hypothetical protein
MKGYTMMLAHQFSALVIFYLTNARKEDQNIYEYQQKDKHWT